MLFITCEIYIIHLCLLTFLSIKCLLVYPTLNYWSFQHIFQSCRYFYFFIYSVFFSCVPLKSLISLMSYSSRVIFSWFSFSLLLAYSIISLNVLSLVLLLRICCISLSLLLSFFSFSLYTVVIVHGYFKLSAQYKFC